MLSDYSGTIEQRKISIKTAAVAICCAVLINALLVIVIHRLQQSELREVKHYDLHEITVTKINPQLLKPPEPQVRKPKKLRTPTPKLIKKRMPKEKLPPMKPVKMSPIASTLDPRLIPLPQLTSVMTAPPRVTTPVVESPPALDQGDGIFELSMVDHPPQALVRNAPIYPAAAKRLGVEGWVDIAFVVDEHGRVADVEVIDSSSRRFHKSATSSVYGWRFKAAIKDGKKVPVKCRQRLKFQMDY